ncbi:acyl--CoA ligase [Methylocystis sp. MJC1]|uniref:class I adenylate-forming enzyme family protein n=1 Tax=Methylocystis sp. MJC1 TaxID=2654282 RepID=UPI0013E9A0C9|nr:class I adenylate-forming enzyme family protein [Methylocystis sp. MJC1]KAF2991202.1 putative sulfoacetate--CoA ligase [Methylocystis sp. MJC1]MBU6526256.1 acyl--CoA ligase [Methylocystis sp. MJC1]UZX12711.1 acyl--CoA ligase [Methylocystis sp. MJC1]
MLSSVTNISELVRGARERFGERAYINPFERGLNAVTYADLAHFVRGLDAFFDDHSVGEDAVVAAVLPNCTLMALLFIAIPAVGRQYLPLHPAQTPSERCYALSAAPVRAVFARSADTSSDGLARIEGVVWLIADDSKFIREMIVRGKEVTDAPAASPDADSVAEIVFTSGSSGKPKGVLLSHRNLLANSAALVTRYGIRAEDRLLTAIPLVHAGGQCFTTLGPLWVGAAATVVPPDLAMVGLWKMVELHSISWTVVMTAFLNAALARSGAPPAMRLKGVLAGGSAVSAETIRDFEARFSVPIYQVYGQTEMAAIVVSEPVGDAGRRVGSVGRTLPGFEVKVVCEDGSDAEPGQTGEIWLAGPSRFLGYLNASEETARKSAGRFVRTGDVGRFDDAGNLWVVDRKDNLIIVGGENIYPAEIENVVRTLGAVEDVIVTAVPDAVLGQQLVLVYKERDAQGIDDRAIDMALRRELSGWKVPRLRLTLPELGLDDWPRTSSGKIARPEVARLVRAFCARRAAPVTLGK